MLGLFEGRLCLCCSTTMGLLADETNKTLCNASNLTHAHSSNPYIPAWYFQVRFVSSNMHFLRRFCCCIQVARCFSLCHVACVAAALNARAFRFAIRIDSIRYANQFKSIRFVKNRPFDSLVFMQFLH